MPYILPFSQLGNKIFCSLLFREKNELKPGKMNYKGNLNSWTNTAARSSNRSSGGIEGRIGKGEIQDKENETRKKHFSVQMKCPGRLSF